MRSTNDKLLGDAAAGAAGCEAAVSGTHAAAAFGTKQDLTVSVRVQNPKPLNPKNPKSPKSPKNPKNPKKPLNPKSPKNPKKP